MCNVWLFWVRSQCVVLMHLQHTSLVHAYLFVSVTPLAIAVGSLLLRKPISSGEVAGALMGVAGAAVLTLGPKAGHREVCNCWHRVCTHDALTECCCNVAD
jgi:drug/metabolite transporter (DMT)-like permease